MIEQYLNAQAVIKRSLSEARIVHFALDLWTSPNHRAFLGVVGQWISGDGKLHGTLLGFCRFHGSHTGVNQAQHFWEVVKLYKLETKVGYFTLDNASNNDTTLTQVGVYLAELGIEFNMSKRRLRCFGHVINLVVKAFLWGLNTEDLEGLATRNGTEGDGQEIIELIESRSQGPMGKLRNICVRICWTPQRRDGFTNKVRSDGSIGSHATLPLVGSINCWGEDYDSLKRTFLLKERIEEFVAAAVRNE